MSQLSQTSDVEPVMAVLLTISSVVWSVAEKRMQQTRQSDDGKSEKLKAARTPPGRTNARSFYSFTVSRSGSGSMQRADAMCPCKNRWNTNHSRGNVRKFRCAPPTISAGRRHQVANFNTLSDLIVSTTLPRFRPVST